MIHQNVKSNGYQLTFVEFGVGDVLIAGSATKDDCKLWFKSVHPPLPLGKQPNSDEPETLEHFRPELLLQFSNIESLDVVITALSTIKEIFQQKQNHDNINS